MMSNFRGASKILRNLIFSNSALLMTLHVKLGITVGSYFLEQFTYKFKELWEDVNNINPILTTNVLLILVNLFNFKVTNYLICISGTAIFRKNKGGQLIPLSIFPIIEKKKVTTKISKNNFRLR